MANRGRPAFTSNKHNVVAALRAVANGDNVKYHVVRKLTDAGFVTAVPVSTGTRGRPAFNYQLTGKGKTYVNFSRNWK